MVKRGYQVGILLIFTLFIFMVAVPVSANPDNSSLLQDNVLTSLSHGHDGYGSHDRHHGPGRPGWQRGDDGPGWHDGWGREEWHHRYSRHGHSHRHIPPHERHHHRHCRYSPHDGLWHYPLR